jgi:hypothetical protein
MLIAGSIVAEAYDIPVATSLSARHLVQQGFAIPAVGLILLAIPALVARVIARRDFALNHSVLIGFRSGALGATAFAAGAALARYAPQFATGLLHRERPTRGLVVEAAIHGVAVPLTSTATGGLLGIALWFSWRSSSESAEHRRLRWLVIGLTALTVAALASQGMVDLHGVSELTALAIRFTFAGVAIVAVRLALQATLLQERAHGSVRDASHRLCTQCEHVVPTHVDGRAGAFCPVCGAALAISVDPQQARTATKTYPAFALPQDSYVEAKLKPVGVMRMAVPLVTTIAVTLGAVVASSTVVSEEQLFQCPPDCGQPPRGMPVAVNPRYVAPDGSFSVSYPAPNAAYEVSLDDHGVTARFTAGDTGSIRLFSKPAAGRTPKEIVKSLVQQRYPGAKVAYEVPNAMVGYEPGYGEVDDFWPVGGNGTATRIRIIVLAAVKNDLALIAGANGPYHAYSPEFGPGRPTGTNLMIALDMGKYINSFTWKGDPPR